jgi:hypothetical protein
LLLVSIANVSGILGHPPEPVIRPAEGRTGWRVMTAGIQFLNSHRLQPHLRDLAAGLRELYRELPAF